MFYNYVYTEMKKEALEQCQTMHTSVYCSRTDKNSLWAVIHYENLDKHLSLMHRLVCRRLGVLLGFGFPLFLFVISYTVHVPPAVSEGPRFPFQCSPRDPHSTVQSTVCGTRSLALPIKDSGKNPQQNNRLKPWDEYFIVCTWLGVQTAAQTSKTLAQKVLSLSWGFFCLPVLLFFFHPLSVWHNVQKCWAAYIPPLPIHVQKIYFFILVKIRLFYLFDWPSMNEDFSKKKKKRKVIISQSSPLVFSTEAVVTVNALKSSHVFPKTALEKDSDYTCAAVKGFLTPAVRRAHYFERLLTFSWSSQSEPFTVNETSLPETRVSFCVFQYLLHEKVCILKLRTKKKKKQETTVYMAAHCIYIQNNYDELCSG